MKRRFAFLIAFATAVLTFGSLMAFVGPQKSGWNRYGHHYHGHYDDHERSKADDRNQQPY